MSGTSPCDENLFIKCGDGYPLSCNFFESENPKGVVIITSAFGTPCGYYGKFAGFLCSSGYHVISFDYRGTGISVYDESFDLGIVNWGLLDIEAVIDYAFNNFDGLPVHFVGHSVGGQVLGLSKSAVKLKSLIFVSSSAPYFQRWGFPSNLKILFASKVLLPFLSSFGKRFNTSLVGLGKLKIPKKAFKMWLRWMTKKDYLFDGYFGIDISGYDNLKQPLLAFGFTDDSFAPWKNIDYLMGFFRNASIDVRIKDPKDLGQRKVGHAGFFRDKFRDSLWREALSFLSENQ